MNKSRLVLSVVAAFAAGAFVFFPFSSFAKSGDTGRNGEIVMTNDYDFLVKNGNRVTLYHIDTTGRSAKSKIVLQDSVVAP